MPVRWTPEVDAKLLEAIMKVTKIASQDFNEIARILNEEGIDVSPKAVKERLARFKNLPSLTGNKDTSTGGGSNASSPPKPVRKPTPKKGIARKVKAHEAIDDGATDKLGRRKRPNEDLSNFINDDEEEEVDVDSELVSPSKKQKTGSSFRVKKEETDEETI